MGRRASVFHASLNRPKTMMGTDPKAFLALAFAFSTLFAMQAYLALIALLPGFTLARLLTKKDPLFMSVFMRYLDEVNAYTSIPRPSDWFSKKRPPGWGRGLPW